MKQIEDLKRIIGPVWDGVEERMIELNGTWGSEDPIFRELIEKVRPKTIIEVGSWQGRSARNMMGVCDEIGLDVTLICVDTWLGAFSAWCDPVWRRALNLKNGRPEIYHDFLSNMVKWKEKVIPMAMASSDGARVMNAMQVKADLIYIDASHEALDVYRDVNLYAQLLRENGVIFGHDLPFHTVKEVMDQMPCGYEDRGEFWILKDSGKGIL